MLYEVITVSALDGVDEVAVNLLKNSMTVKLDERNVSVSDIIAAVEHSGYGAALAKPARGKAVSAADIV